MSVEYPALPNIEEPKSSQKNLAVRFQSLRVATTPGEAESSAQNDGTPTEDAQIIEYKSQDEDTDMDDPDVEEEDKVYTREEREEINRVLKWPKRAYYEILGVSEESTTKDIKKRYLKVIKIIHPDKTKFKEAKRVSQSECF